MKQQQQQQQEQKRKAAAAAAAAAVAKKKLLSPVVPPPLATFTPRIFGCDDEGRALHHSPAGEAGAALDGRPACSTVGRARDPHAIHARVQQLLLLLLLAITRRRRRQQQPRNAWVRRRRGEGGVEGGVRLPVNTAVV
jgi:hypothetical protein